MQAVLTRLVALAALALAAGLASAQVNLPLPGGVPGFPVSTVKIDPVLSSVLQSARLDQPIQAVLTFDHYPTATELLAIRAAGVQVRPLRALPMVGVQGTSLQIRLLPALFVGKVDTYASSPGLAVVFSASGLSPGAHTLTLEVTGTKNPASTDTWVIIDAFEVTP